MRTALFFLCVALIPCLQGAGLAQSHEDPRPVPVIEMKTAADGKWTAVIGTDGQRAIQQDDLQVREGNIGYARGEEAPFNGWVYRTRSNQDKEFVVWCCQCLNGIPEGLEFQFFDPKEGKGGGIRCIREWKGRKKNGLASTYDEKGTLRCLENYVDDKQSGSFRSFHENGKISSERTYKDDKVDGLERYWDGSGQLQLEQNRSGGEPNGPYKRWYDNGKLKESGEYALVEKNGGMKSEQHGIWKEFREDDGSLCIEREYDKGTRRRETFFNNAGARRTEILWTPERAHLTVHFKEKNGFPTQLWMQNTDTKKHGTQVSWYFDQEQISGIENFVNDQRHGPFEYYGFKGELTRRGYFRNNTETDSTVERPMVPEFEEALQKYLAMGVPKGANWPKSETKTGKPVPVEVPATAASVIVTSVTPGLTTDSASIAEPATDSLSVASVLEAVVSTVASSTTTSPVSPSVSATLTVSVSQPPLAATEAVSAPASPSATVVQIEPASPAAPVSTTLAVARVTCPACGKEVAPGTFCLECGSSLAQEKKCIKCQRILPVKAKFCNDCGAAQTAPAVAAAPTPARPPEVQDDPPSPVVATPKPASENTAEKLLSKARASSKAEKFGDVISRASELLRLEPSHIEGLFLRGTAYRQKGRFAEAIADLRKVVEKRPDHASAYYQLGLTYRAEKNLEKAVACLEKVAKLDSKHERSRFYLFDCLSDLGRFEESLPYIQDAERLDPSNSNNTYNVGFNLIKLKRFREALDKLLPIEKKADRLPEILKCMAVCHAGLGNIEKALDYCRSYLKRHPDDSWASEFVKEQSQSSAAPAVGTGNPVKADLNSYITHKTVQQIDSRMQDMFKEMATMSTKSNTQVQEFLERIQPFLAEAKKAMSRVRPATASIRQIHDLYLQSINDVAEGSKLLSRAIREGSRKLLDAGTVTLKRGTDKRQTMLQMISEISGK